MSHSAIILCGGRASRFNFENKALIQLAGRPLLEHVLARVRDVVDDVVVVARDDAQAAQIRDACNVLVTADKIKGFGPVAGVLAGLEYVKSDWVLLVACDIPLVSQDVIRLLFDRAKAYDGAIPQWEEGMIEPLHAVYRREVLLPVIRTAIDSGIGEVHNCVKALKRVNYVPVKELQRIDPELHTFINVNTREDLERVRSIIEDAGMCRF